MKRTSELLAAQQRVARPLMVGGLWCGAPRMGGSEGVRCRWTRRRGPTTVLRVVSIEWNAVVLTAHVGGVRHVRNCCVVLQRHRSAGSASKLAPTNEHYGCGRCQGHHR